MKQLQIVTSWKCKQTTGNSTGPNICKKFKTYAWAWKGGAIAKNARKALKAKTGKSVVTGENFLPPQKSKTAKKPRDKKKKRKGT